MKTRLTRIKKFVSDHRGTLAFSAGVVTAAAPAAYILSQRFVVPQWIEVVIDETPEELKALMEGTGAVRLSNPTLAQTIILASRPTEALLEA